MTVEPGFGGQKFMSDQIEKIKQIRQMIGQKNIEIEVDGGINLENANDVKEAGANVLVSGSTIFNCTDYKSIINKLRVCMIFLILLVFFYQPTVSQQLITVGAKKPLIKTISDTLELPALLLANETVQITTVVSEKIKKFISKRVRL